MKPEAINPGAVLWVMHENKAVQVLITHVNRYVSLSCPTRYCITYNLDPVAVPPGSARDEDDLYEGEPTIFFETKADLIASL